MQVFSIEQVNQVHWRDTIVLQGETPEAYTIRRQEARLREGDVIGVHQVSLLVWVRTEGEYEIVGFAR